MFVIHPVVTTGFDVQGWRREIPQSLFNRFSSPIAPYIIFSIV
jgi:hypothetical protein